MFSLAVAAEYLLARERFGSSARTVDLQSKTSSVASTACKSTRYTAHAACDTDHTAPPRPPTPVSIRTASRRITGAVVDCGSGHTSLTFYSTTPGSATEVVELGRAYVKHAVDGGNLALTDIIPGSKGRAFRGTTLAARTAEFIAAIDQALTTPVSVRTRKAIQLPAPVDFLYVGATGGVRDALATARMTQGDIAATRAAFIAAFNAKVPVVKFEVLPGADEARWELQGAEIIWGGAAKGMFPESAAKGGSTEAVSTIGLFSGGGKSMQLGSAEFGLLSFPFSTFPAELEERQGAAPDAWLDDAKWGRFEGELRAKVENEAARRDRFDGCFVATTMNHRAAFYAGIAEQPLTAATAVVALKAMLPQLRSQSGELYEEMMTHHTPGSTYPLARITAMHTYRLATVLDSMFAPGAQLFFARDGIDAAGTPIDCEWTVGAFVAEATMFVT